jgi:hypothetical protein
VDVNCCAKVPNCIKFINGNYYAVISLILFTPITGGRNPLYMGLFVIFNTRILRLFWLPDL